MKKIFIVLFGITLFSSNGYTACTLRTDLNANTSANEYLIFGRNKSLECDDEDCPDGTKIYSFSRQHQSNFPRVGDWWAGDSNYINGHNTQLDPSTGIKQYRSFTCKIESDGDYWREDINDLHPCSADNQLCIGKAANTIVCTKLSILGPEQLPDNINGNTYYHACSSVPCICSGDSSNSDNTTPTTPTTPNCAEANLYNQAIQKLQAHLQTLQDKCK